MNNIKLYFLSKIIKTDYWIILIGMFSVLPMLLIAIYANPSADDFAFYNRTNHVGYLQAQLDWYQFWSGRYFSTAFLSMKFLMYKPFYFYKVIPFFLIINLFFSIYKISQLIFGNNYKRESLILTFFVLVIYLMQMPTLYEGFYWLSGAVTYQLSNILSIWLLYFIVKLMDTNNIKYFSVVIFLTIVVVGTNETNMLLIDFLLVIILLFNYYKNRKFNYYLILILFIALICSVIVYLSPGNAVRASAYPQKKNIIYALLKTFSGIATHMALWLPFMIFTSFVYINYLNKQKIKFESTFLNINPYFVGLILFGILIVGFFTSCWSVGRQPPLRTLNSIYFFLLLGFIYLIFVLFQRFNAKDEILFSFSKEVKGFLILLIFFQLAKNNNIKTVYNDLLSGVAAGYNMECINRYELIKNNLSFKCIVPQFKHRPKTIFINDIKTYPNDWSNEVYSIYFGKKTIVTQ